MSALDGAAAHARRAQAAAPLFAALGDETRLQLLMRLAASGPVSCSCPVLIFAVDETPNHPVTP